MENDIVSKKINDFVLNEAEKHGYQIVDLLNRGSRNFSLEVVVDKEGGITLDECVAFNRQITFWIEESAMLEGGFTVDVCSPGLDREIKSERSFLWATGKQVEVRIHDPLDGKNVLVGKLIEGGPFKELKLQTAEGDEILIGSKNIAKVRLYVSV